MVSREDLARLRGTPAHAEALAAMERALGLLDDPGDQLDDQLDAQAEEPALPEPIPFPGAYHTPDPEPVVEAPAVAPVEADVAAAEALGELMAQPSKPADPAALARLITTQRDPLPRERLAELEAEWKRTPAAAAGVPFLTCLRYPMPNGQREHHISWRLVYWLNEAGETCAAWRCLRCYPELERITTARQVEQRAHERMAALAQA